MYWDDFYDHDPDDEFYLDDYYLHASAYPMGGGAPSLLRRAPSVGSIGLGTYAAASSQGPGGGGLSGQFGVPASHLRAIHGGIAPPGVPPIVGGAPRLLPQVLPPLGLGVSPSGYPQ